VSFSRSADTVAGTPRHDAHVRRFAQSMCGTPQDAEDATQEALIILYRKIGTLRASGALASWMFRIVARDCLRRFRLMRRHMSNVEPEYEVPMRSAEDDVAARLEAERVAAAIAALPPEQRNVLIMRDVQGYPGRWWPTPSAPAQPR
jgi:RNA polymerase sigma factor (sigma-70 family)